MKTDNLPAHLDVVTGDSRLLDDLDGSARVVLLVGACEVGGQVSERE